MSKKKSFIRAISFLCIFLTIVVITVGGIIYYFLYDLERLPEKEFIAEYTSPSEEYNIRFYLNESSLSAPSIKGVLYNDNNKKIKSIYNEYPQDTVVIKWINDVTVIINNHEINIIEDVYDWRRE